MSVSPSNSSAHLRCAADESGMGGKSAASSMRPASIVACSLWLFGLSIFRRTAGSSPLCTTEPLVRLAPQAVKLQVQG